MTRFARAKGSKASNEKKPEDATSWSEMRSSMLAKKLNKSEELLNSTPEEPIKNNKSEKTEWASLGDDTASGSSLLLKQHSGNKNNNVEVKNEKKKKKSLNNSEEKKNPAGVNESKGEKRKAKQKKSVCKDADIEINIKKKGKKRKLVEAEEDSETAVPKKKFLKNKEANSMETTEHKQENKRDKTNKQIVNTAMKSKNFKKEKANLNCNIGKDNKVGKKFKNRSFQERNSAVEELVINGEKIPITKFQGFYVTLEDAERLKKLRSEMIREGIPKSKLEAAIKLERRRAEKALSRLKKSVCFHCRGHGHLLSNCPDLVETENTGTGICYKCGSTEHSATECKVVRGTNYQFAECFICKEQGHIARQCPDNPRGLYPQGGACRECGDVTHLRKDCPKVQSQKAEEVVTVGLRSDRDLECLDEEIANREKQNTKKQVKKNSVKF